MSANYYTPIEKGDPVSDTFVNAILSSLDTQITAQAVAITALEAEIAGAIIDKESLADAVTQVIGQSPPSSASDTGTAGELRGDADKLYVCVAPDTWKIITLENWS